MSTVSFTGAGSVSFPVDSVPLRHGMPAPDGGNPDLTVGNGTPYTIWVRFGGNVGDPPSRCAGDQPGVTTLLPGQAVMFTANAAVAAAGAAGRVTNDGGSAAGASSFCVAGSMAGGTVTVTRGTASAAITF